MPADPPIRTGISMTEINAGPAARGPDRGQAEPAASPAHASHAGPAHGGGGHAGGAHAGPAHSGPGLSHADPAHAAPRGSKWWTLTAVCLGTFMLLLDVTIVNVALPDIQSALHSSFSGLQWVVDAYALSLAALLLTAGSLADMFGRRRLYLVGLVIFVIGSLLCGVAATTLMLQLSRGLQGVGGAIMFAVSLALLADAFRGKDRGIAFGVWGAITGLAVAIGPLLGGILTSGLSWRWIFFVNLPIGVVAVVITLLKVAESRSPAARRPDWIGFVLFTAALAALVYGLIESNQRSFGNALVLGCLIGAGVLLAAFVVAESRMRQPMFDLSLFRKPTFSGGSFAAFSLSASIFSLLLYLVLYIQDILGYSALGTGVRLLVISAGILATSTIAGRLSSRVPVRYLIGPGMLLVGVGLLLMRGLDAGSAWTHLIPGMLVSGAGVGMVNPPLASTAVGVVQPQQAGMASGINSTFRQVGIATGIALLGTLFSSQLRDYVAAHASALAGHGPQVATAIQDGGIGTILAHLPPSARPAVEQLAKAAFASGLNSILLVAAIIALAGGVVGLTAIRRKDFAH
jgi:EmrB/QacA subfamily drug resistance transporter